MENTTVNPVVTVLDLNELPSAKKTEFARQTLKAVLRFLSQQNAAKLSEEGGIKDERERT